MDEDRCEGTISSEVLGEFFKLIGGNFLYQISKKDSPFYYAFFPWLFYKPVVRLYLIYG
jgi:hypothetical protein